MILNAAVQNAIIIIRELKKYPEINIPAYVIARDYHVSSTFLDQICRKLRDNKIIKSHSGPGGGYELLKKDVTVKELIDILSQSNYKKVHDTAFDIQSKVNTALNNIRI